MEQCCGQNDEEKSDCENLLWISRLDIIAFDSRTNDKAMMVLRPAAAMLVGFDYSCAWIAECSR